MVACLVEFVSQFTYFWSMDVDHGILQGEVVARLILHATNKSKPPVNITREEAMRVLGMIDLD